MGDSSTQNHQTTASRLRGLRNTGGNIGGEIVQVQGGHIVRSLCRKDRHSKVCTAKGPRDRRVRLSAHTAIQFYDVQDRLGYDRPSKAVDWLIKKAKSAIDELEELPAWTPTTGSINLKNHVQSPHHHQLQQQQPPPNDNNSSFLPPSMDSDSIADTIKSFFPMGASADTNTKFYQQNFQHQEPDLLLPVSSNQHQDLRLSLQSLQDDPLLLHHQHQHETGLFASRSNFDESDFSRMVSWNSGGDTSSGFLQSMCGQTQLFSQRRPLQSSNTPSIRAWIDPSAYDHQATTSSFQYYPSSVSGIGFASAGEFSGFRVPARIQGEEEEHDKLSSASSDSRH